VVLVKQFAFKSYEKRKTRKIYEMKWDNINRRGFQILLGNVIQAIKCNQAESTCLTDQHPPIQISKEIYAEWVNFIA